MTKIQEIWKDIPDYEGKYQASNLGRIKSLPRFATINTERILKDCSGSHGYRFVGLSNGASRKSLHVARLVLMAFRGIPKPKIQANHKNGIKTDNRLENLEWVTCKENIRHGFKLGLLTGPLGERSSASKLKTTDVLRIRELSKSGLSYKEIAPMFGVLENNICRIVNRKRWNHI